MWRNKGERRFRKWQAAAQRMNFKHALSTFYKEKQLQEKLSPTKAIMHERIIEKLLAVTRIIIMKRLILLIGLQFLTTILFSQSVVEGPFDKKKWKSSASYRYDLVLRSKDIFHEATNGKSVNEIIKILGTPSSIELRKNTGILLKNGWTTVEEATDLTYCLGSKRKKTLKNNSESNCDGSFIILHFYQDRLVDRTIFSVEK